MNRRESLKLLTTATGATLLQPWTALAMAADNSEPAAGISAGGTQPAFSWLPLGSVRPTGWIRAQMLRDLNQGFAGCLGQLCHEASSDIFVTNRNSRHAQDVANHLGVAWWNGETEGNWRAGFIMMAYLTGDPRTMREADDYVRHILSSQDEDGYLGAFAADSRFVHPGELWTQACLLRGLLDYAELAEMPAVQTAVQRCADLTVSVYRSGRKPVPWGENHDLMIVDVMERLFELTGDARYRDFSEWLYDEWSRNVSSADTSLPSLLNPKAPYVQHGVHTYESMRVPLWLAVATGREDLGTAARNALAKLDRYTEPGGSAVSEEAIGNLAPNPTSTEYEYCATKEIQFTLESALQKTGAASLGDRVEKVWFNDAQGARTADGRAIAYLSPDNRLRCDGRTPDGARREPRNKYSPTHADVAVCCNPNATNVAALFVRGMWMRRGDDTLAALLYGPCRVSARIAGVNVVLEEQTAYPFEDHVTIAVHPERPASFSLLLRNPEWSEHTEVSCGDARILREGNYWRVTKHWGTGDAVRIKFVRNIRTVTAVNGEVALQYGPLVFARPLASTESVIRTYPLPGFADTHDQPIPGKQEELAFSAQSQGQAFGFQPATTAQAADLQYPFDRPVLVLRGSMLRTGDGQPVSVDLVPLGNAPILRRMTHPVST